MDLRLRAARALAAGLLSAGIMLTACGTPASPQPPSLKLPQQVRDLSATRTGDDVTLHWTMPRRTTDKVILKGDQDAHICRKLENGPCIAAGDLRIGPISTAEFSDPLSANLTSGPPRLLTYVVELRNHAGRTAGPSNPAYAASGPAPAPITGLSADVRAQGIVLLWQRAGAPGPVRILRVAGPKTEQTLETTALDQAIDKDAAYDNTYLYTVQRYKKLTLAGHNILVAGLPSQRIKVVARDVFPPQTPAGLVAVADPEGHAIDLSWSADTEPDLAGYAVYRSGPGSPAVRISPVVAGPSFHDTTAVPGVRYQYSVSAIDRDGNESPRSGEVGEMLPGK